MGSIRLRPESDTLYFDFRYRNVRCRELTTLPATKSNQLRLERVLRTIEAEITAGTFSYRKYFPNSNRAATFEPLGSVIAPPTQDEIVQAGVLAAQSMNLTVLPTVTPVGTAPLFADFADQWYEEREIDWKRSTRMKVTDIIDRHLVPRFRGRRLNEINKAELLAFRNYLDKEYRNGKGLSHSRINGILNILQQILDEAADRHGFVSPYRGIKPLRVGKTLVDPFTIEEVQQILANVPARHEPFYTVAFFTGMRTAELLGLKWDALDYGRSQILIRQTWVYGELDTPKNNLSDRTIEMSTPVRAALMRQQELTAGSGSEFVFCTATGQPLSRHNLANRIWRPTLKALGLRHRRPYQTRHTAATLWLAAGEAPEWIARQMGHSSTRMLFTVYSRFVPNLVRKDGSMFELLIGSRFGADPTPPATQGDHHAA